MLNKLTFKLTHLMNNPLVRIITGSENFLKKSLNVTVVKSNRLIF
jgi:hypothetical protein